MKKIIYILPLLILAAPAQAAEWYNGGTLQKADAAAWLKGAPEDRLATSADFLAALNGITDPSKVDDQNDFKMRAAIMQSCLDKLAQSPGTPRETPAANLVIRCNQSANDSKTGMPE